MKYRTAIGAVVATFLISMLVLNFGCSKNAVVPTSPAVSSGEQAPTILPPNASSEQLEAWIQSMRAKGTNENEIAAALDKYGAQQIKTNGCDAAQTRQDAENGARYQNARTSKGLVQKNGRLVIYTESYCGIKGQHKPGSMEVSAIGTQGIYCTSHIGHGGGEWMEIGVSRWSSDSKYYLFTYVSTRSTPWKTIREITSSQALSFHSFEVYASSAYSGGKYYCTLYWDGSLVDYGWWLDSRYNNPDACFETFTVSGAYGTYTSTYNYFKDMYVNVTGLGYKKWGSEVLDGSAYADSPVNHSFSTVSGFYHHQSWMRTGRVY